MASKTDDRIPLPYCKDPINAEPEPAKLGTISKAAVVAHAAIIPFIEKNMKMQHTTIARLSTCNITKRVIIDIAVAAMALDILSKYSKEYLVIKRRLK